MQKRSVLERSPGESAGDI